MKFLVIFPPGCYGSLLSWMIVNGNRTLTTSDLPFNQFGNAHRGVLEDHKTYFEIVNDGDLHNFINSDCTVGMMHPSSEDTATIVHEILSNYHSCKIVAIGYNHTSKIWVMNNQYSKMFKDWFYHVAEGEFVKFMRLWGNKPFDQYETWELREGLSNFLNSIDGIDDSANVRGCLNDVETNTWGIYIDVTELRDNFVGAVTKIFDYCGIDYIPNTLIFVEQAWRGTQLHLHKDRLVDTIVDNVVNLKDFTIDQELSLIDEAYIQQRLRLQGIELRCYGLNVFPRTLKEFQDIAFYNFNSLVQQNFKEVMLKIYNKKLTKEQAINLISEIIEKL